MESEYQVPLILDLARTGKQSRGGIMAECIPGGVYVLSLIHSVSMSGRIGSQ